LLKRGVRREKRKRPWNPPWKIAKSVRYPSSQNSEKMKRKEKKGHRTANKRGHRGKHTERCEVSGKKTERARKLPGELNFVTKKERGGRC